MAVDGNGRRCKSRDALEGLLDVGELLGELVLHLEDQTALRLRLAALLLLGGLHGGHAGSDRHGVGVAR